MAVGKGSMERAARAAERAQTPARGAGERTQAPAGSMMERLQPAVKEVRRSTQIPDQKSRVPEKKSPEAVRGETTGKTPKTAGGERADKMPEAAGAVKVPKAAGAEAAGKAPKAVGAEVAGKASKAAGAEEPGKASKAAGAEEPGKASKAAGAETASRVDPVPAKADTVVTAAETIAAPKKEVLERVVYQKNSGILDRAAEPNEIFGLGDAMPVYYL